VSRLILSDELLAALGAIVGPTKQVRRVVIDIQAGHATMVHVERFGDEQLLDVVRALDGVEIRTVDTSTLGGADG
jgi:hypothetical protein